MKFGHPRVYNPFGFSELDSLQREYDTMSMLVHNHVKEANEILQHQRIVTAQMRDCYLTTAEQIARMEALDEVGAPQ